MRILRIDTWGENPFFDPLVVQANLHEGAFGADDPALKCQLQGSGGGGVGVSDPGPATPPGAREGRGEVAGLDFVFFSRGPEENTRVT